MKIRIQKENSESLIFPLLLHVLEENKRKTDFLSFFEEYDLIRPSTLLVVGSPYFIKYWGNIKLCHFLVQFQYEQYVQLQRKKKHVYCVLFIACSVTEVTRSVLVTEVWKPRGCFEFAPVLFNTNKFLSKVAKIIISSEFVRKRFNIPVSIQIQNLYEANYEKLLQP